MTDRILTILMAHRRRFLAIQSAEAAGVSGTAAGVASALVMGGWILGGRYPAWGCAACLAAVALAGVLAAGPVRRRLLPERALAWYVPTLLAAAGLAGAALVATGAFVHIPKNVLIGLVPLGAAGGVAASLAGGLSLASVARWLDRRARTQERLATALELVQRAGAPGGAGPRSEEHRLQTCATGAGDAGFADAVRRQALTVADGGALAKVRFWRRTSALPGALGLAILAAVLMLPWRPLASPEAQLREKWGQVAPQAAESLEEVLAAITRGDTTAGKLAEQARRLEELTRSLRVARPEEARNWQAKVAELQDVTDALRRAAASGQLDQATTARLNRLIAALEQVTTDMAAGMAGESPALAGNINKGGEGVAAGAASRPAVESPEYVSVYDPAYATSQAAGGATEPGAPPASAVRVPLDKQWSAACARASQAISTNAVPAKYHQLVRDYFH
jgi:hypothetical protein